MRVILLSVFMLVLRSVAAFGPRSALTRTYVRKSQPTMVIY
jgi:hypothetical protein